MKLAIFLIALIGLSLTADSSAATTTAAAAASSANTPAVVRESATTAIAKSEAAAAKKDADAAKLALSQAVQANDAAKAALTLKLVPNTKWTELQSLKDAVTSKMALLKTQDTALAALVATVAEKSEALAGAQVDKDCQTMTAAMRKSWQTLSTGYDVAGTPYTSALTNFVEPKAESFTTVAANLKAAVKKVKDQIAAKILATAYTVPATNCDTLACANPKNHEAWDPTLAWTTGAAVAQTTSYQALKCPYPGVTVESANNGGGAGSAICKDCDAATLSQFLKADKFAGSPSNVCTFQYLMNRAGQMNVMMTKLQGLNMAKGQKTALAAIQVLLGNTDTNVAHSTTAYQAKIAATAGVQNTFMQQVDLLATVLLQMQQTQTVAVANAGLLKTLTEANKAAAVAAAGTASTQWTAANDALGALETTNTNAVAAVVAQWTVANTSVGAVEKSMIDVSLKAGALASAEQDVKNAMRSLGQWTNLYASSQASDKWAQDQQASYVAQTALSKADYDNVVAMKKANGSSITQQTIVSLLSGFIMLLAYRKF